MPRCNNGFAFDAFQDIVALRMCAVVTAMFTICIGLTVYIIITTTKIIGNKQN